jgi:flagellar protein FlaJ
MKKPSAPCRKIRKILKRLRAEISPTPEKLNIPATSNAPKNTDSDFGHLQAAAYQLLGEKIKPVSPLFNGLDLSLRRAGLKTSFKAYISLTIFCTILASLALLVMIPVTLFFALNITLLPAILFGVGSSLFAFAFTIIGFYVYPAYRADVMKRQLENELPFTAGYMAILASAGVSPAGIFSSLSNLSAQEAVATQAKEIVTNVNLFGSDIISALEKASMQTPSESFRQMIQGLISTIRSGGNLAAYLHEKSVQYIRLRKIDLKKYSDTLSMLSEFYVAVLLTGPLMLVVMLIVMAMLGGGPLWIFSPDMLLNLLTYFVIPLGAIAFLIILDATSPKW